MNSRLALLLTAVCVAAVTRLEAQTINWGGEFGDVLTDSDGNLLDENFTFELGSFVSTFLPDETNVTQWAANWRMFDTADFNAVDGYFTGEAVILNGVTSDNLAADPGTFAGYVAYLWIRNNNQPIAGSEWLLVRSDQWTFPLTGGDCCDNDVIEWSITDLDSNDTPLWGRQSNVLGDGAYTTNTSGSSNLQTFTFSVPEPSTALLTALAAGFALMRRRRI